MPNTITVAAPTEGRAILMQGGQVWNGTAMEAFADANFAAYLLTPVRIGTTANLWLYTVPALLPSGDYDMATYEGDTPVVGDTVDQAASFYWDGTNAWLPRTSLAAQKVTLTLNDSYGSPVADASVWVTASEDILDVVAGTFSTDSDGEVVMQLVPGNYFRWASKDGEAFTNPQAFSVSA